MSETVCESPFLKRNDSRLTRLLPSGMPAMQAQGGIVLALQPTSLARKCLVPGRWILPREFVATEVEVTVGTILA
jgi:hypothetical protein